MDDEEALAAEPGKKVGQNSEEVPVKVNPYTMWLPSYVKFLSGEDGPSADGEGSTVSLREDNKAATLFFAFACVLLLAFNFLRLGF